MSVSKDRREMYEDLTSIERETVDAAFAAVAGVFHKNNFRAHGDDRAENLVGAITRYLEECRS